MLEDLVILLLVFVRVSFERKYLYDVCGIFWFDLVGIFHHTMCSQAKSTTARETKSECSFGDN